MHPIHVINMDVVDNAVAAEAGAKDALELCQKVRMFVCARVQTPPHTRPADRRGVLLLLGPHRRHLLCDW